MKKKKAIKIAAATAMAASSFTAVAPFSTEAAVNVSASVTTATTQMQKAYNTYFNAALKGQAVSAATVQAQVTLAQKYYATAQTNIKKYAGSKKTYYTSKLNAALPYLKNAQHYISGEKYAEGVKTQAAALEAAVTKGDVEAVATAYNAYSATIDAAEQKVRDYVPGKNAENAVINANLKTPVADFPLIKAYVFASKAIYWINADNQATAQARLDTANTAFNKGNAASNLGQAVSSYIKSIQDQFNAHFTAVKSVGAVADIQVNEGASSVDLPKQVDVTLANGQTVQKDVTWTLTGLDLNKPATYPLTGKVAGTDLPASVNVVVNAVAPQVTAVSAVDATTIKVTFDKAVTASDLATLTVAGADGNNVSFTSSVDGNVATLTLNTPFYVGTTLVVNYGGVQKIVSGVVADPELSNVDTAVNAVQTLEGLVQNLTADSLANAETAATTAEDAVAKVNTQSVKTDLTNRIAAAKATIQKFKDDAATAVKVTAAQDAVNALETAVKGDLTTQANIDAAKGLATTAQDAVNALPAGNENIQSLNDKITAATQTITDAQNTLDTATNVAAATKAVTDLEAAVTDLKDQAAIDKATGLVAPAETAVAALPEGNADAVALQTRLDTAKAAIQTAQNALNFPPVTDVSSITKTDVTVTLDQAPAVDLTTNDAAKFNVTVAGVAVPVTAVTKVASDASGKTYKLAVALDNKEGTVTVNGKESAAFDFKAPEIKSVTPVSSTQFDITYSEAVNAGLAAVTSNYKLVQTGTALTTNVQSVEVIAKDKVRVTTASLTKDTSYTVTVSGQQDVSANKNTMTSSSMSFTAIKDVVKPTVVSAVSTDANKIEVTMSEEMKTAPDKSTVNVYAYKTDGTLDTTNPLTVDTVAKSSTDPSKLIVTLNNATKLVNGGHYQVAVSGGTDLEGNPTADGQKADFTGVADAVAPTVKASSFVNNKLTITYSEPMDTANLTDSSQYYVFNALTGDPVSPANYTITKNSDNTEVYITFTNGLVEQNTYSVRINGQTDASVTPNALKANTIVQFTTPVVVSPVKLSSASTAGLDGKSVKLQLSGSVNSADAENIANYKIVSASDATKTLAVTKAVYNSTDKTVTLTTDPQEQGTGNYKVTVSNFTNLSDNTADLSATFDGIDTTKPVLNSIQAVGKNTVDLTYSEKMNANQSGISVQVVEKGTANPVATLGVTATGTDNKLRLNFADGVLSAGKTYTVTVTNAADSASTPNSSVAQTLDFTAVSDTTAPLITNAVSTNSATVQLGFSEEVAQSGTLSVDNFVLKKGDTVIPWAAGTTFTLSGNKLTIVNGGATPAAILEDGASYTITAKTAVSGSLADLSGNQLNDASYSFTGVKDTVKPQLVSAAMSSTSDTQLALTFSENVAVGVNPADFLVTNAVTGEPISVTAAVTGTGDKANQVTLTLGSSTAAGTQYRVYVSNANQSVKDLAVTPNLLDTAHAVALFTGVDKTAPSQNVTEKLTSANTLELGFNEQLDPASVSAADFSVSGVTVTNAVVLADGKTVKLTFTGNTDTSLNPAVSIQANEAITDLAGNTLGSSVAVSLTETGYTDAATPSLLGVNVPAVSGVQVLGSNGVYATTKVSDSAIGTLGLTFSEAVDPAKFNLTVYDANGKVALSAAALSTIKAALLDESPTPASTLSKDIQANYDTLKSAMNSAAGTQVTKLVFDYTDAGSNSGTFTININ